MLKKILASKLFRFLILMSCLVLWVCWTQFYWMLAGTIILFDICFTGIMLRLIRDLPLSRPVKRSFDILLTFIIAMLLAVGLKYFVIAMIPTYPKIAYTNATSRKILRSQRTANRTRTTVVFVAIRLNPTSLSWIVGPMITL